MPAARAFRPGDRITNKGHVYIVTGEDWYPRADGWLGRLITLRGSCAVCRAPFSCATTPSLSRPLLRTCTRHRGQYRPGPKPKKQLQPKRRKAHIAPVPPRRLAALAGKKPAPITPQRPAMPATQRGADANPRGSIFE